MKLRESYAVYAVVIFVLTSVAVADDAPRVAADAQRVTASQTSQSGGDTLTPDLFTGTLSGAIPIELPPGRRGMAPTLALTYRSQGPNTWVGVGWDLDIGAIERSSRGGVRYDGDRFVQRNGGGARELIATGSNEYRAKIESDFTRFRQRSEGGAFYWEAIDRSGVKYVFGRTAEWRWSDPADGHRIFRWPLERVEDPHGNYFTVSYDKSGHISYVKEIRYTGSSDLTPGNVVIFDREGRPDVAASFLPGFEISIDSRLRSITVVGAGKITRAYVLAYSPSAATSRSLLTNVRVFDAEGVKFLDIATLGYTQPAAGWSSPAWGGGPAPGIPIGNQCLPGDFTGDGRTDFACYTGSNGVWHMALSTGSGWSSPGWGSGPAPGIPVGNQCIPGDYNGDGRTDLACYTGSSGTWHMALSTGSGWSSPGWGGGPAPGIPVGNQCLAGDFNGDGKADLACYTGSGGSWHMALSTGSGWSSPGWGGGPAPGIPVGNQCFAGDLNGDGKTDLACYTGSGGNWHIALSIGSGWSSVGWGGGPAPGIPVGNQCIAGDYNGDTKMDLACYTGSAGVWHMALSTGSGWSSPGWGGGPAPGIPVGSQCIAGDFNGDGRTDMACYTGGGGAWHMALSGGTRWISPGWGGGPAPGIPVGNQCIGGDFTGDGKADLACYTGANGTWHMALTSTGIPDLLSSKRELYSGTTAIDYASSTEFPNTLLPFALPVVRRLTRDTGTGQPGATQFQYAGGYYSLSEHDARGFNVVRVTSPADDDNVSLQVETRFHQGNDLAPDQNDPSVSEAFMRGKPYRVTIGDSTGRLYSRTETTYAEVNVGSPHYAPPSDVSKFLCDSGGCSTAQTRVTYTYDKYGNVTREEQYGDVANPDDDATTEREFAPDETAWIISLPAREAVYEGRGASKRQISGATYSYDGAPGCEGNPGSPTPIRGDLTAVDPWTADHLSVGSRSGYDKYGNIVCGRDANGNVTRHLYDASFTFLTSTTDPLGHTTERLYQGVNWSGDNRGLYSQLRVLRDENRVETLYEYDSLGREVRRAVDATQSWDTTSYVAIGTIGQQHIRHESSAGLVDERYMDGFGRTLRATSSGAAGKRIATEFTYDRRAFLVARTVPHEDGRPASVTNYRYDPLGRVVDETHPDGSRRRQCYELRLLTVVDENRHRVRETHDAYGRLIRLDEYNGEFDACVTSETAPTAADYRTKYLTLAGINVPQTESPAATTTYAYDGGGRLKRIIDAKGNKTTIDYDTLGRRVRMSSPDTGTWTFNYDGNGNVIQQKDARGRSVFSSYDAAGRVVQRDFGTPKKQGKGDVVFTYDGPGAFTIGRLTSTKAKKFESAVQYDAAGRISAELDRISGKRYAFEYRYDSVGRLTEVVYPDKAVINYTYDGPALSSVNRGTTVLAAFRDYTPLGSPGRITYANGVVTGFAYYDGAASTCRDVTFRVCTTTVLAPSGQTLYGQHYRYDLAGNVRSIEGTNVPGREMIYDERNRLVAVGDLAPGQIGALPAEVAPVRTLLEQDKYWRALSAIAAGVQWRDAISYDAIHNIAWRHTLGVYEYVGQAHAVTKVGRTILRYDASGNRIDAGTFGYRYDDEERLTEVLKANVTITKIIYDRAGNRVLTRSGSHRTYAPNRLYECTDGRCSRFVYAGDHLIAIERGKTEHFVTQDHLGSSVLVTNGQGVVVAQFRYTAFGTLDGGGSNTESAGNRLFIGAKFDPAVNLSYFGSRYYDPVIGAFITPDAMLVRPEIPGALNLYTYASNNPCTYIDRDGRFAWFVPIIAGAIIGGLQAAARGDNILEGIARGAIVGGFVTIAGFAGGGAWGALANLGAGAAAGYTNAAIWGGDRLEATLWGAAFGLAGYYLSMSSAEIRIFDQSGTGMAAGIAGTANYLVNGAAHGALFGGAYAAARGQDVGAGVLQGAEEGAIAASANAAFGHIVGVAATQKVPVWKDGAWRFDNSWDGITFGNVVIGNEANMQAATASNPTKKNIEHEVAHSHQAWSVGATWYGYGATHLLSMFAAGIASGLNGSGFVWNQTSVHEYGFAEKDWIEVPY